MLKNFFLPACLAFALCSHACLAAQSYGAAGKPSVESLVQWIGQTGDNREMPFAVIDKKTASLHVFAPNGLLKASSPVLLGAAKGDYSVPDIGARALKDIKPHERTTPSGRYVTEPGVNLRGEKIVWIDYEAGISMHSVRSDKKSERRLERLQTTDPSDNRISYGCVNVPVAFYRAAVQPVFGAARAVLYILPEDAP